MRGLITLIFLATSCIAVAYCLGYEDSIKSTIHSMFYSVEKAVDSLGCVIKSAKSTGEKAFNSTLGDNNINTENLTKTITNVFSGAGK